MSETTFGVQNWAQKSQNYQKSISREPLVVESCLTTQNKSKTWFTTGGLRYVYPLDNRKFPKNIIFCFWGLFNDKIAWFSVSRELPVVKNWLIPQNDNKNGFTMNVLRYLYASDNRKCPKNEFFYFFSRSLNDEISKVSISREPYIIKLADFSKWPKDPSFY